MNSFSAGRSKPRLSLVLMIAALVMIVRDRWFVQRPQMRMHVDMGALIVGMRWASAELGCVGVRVIVWRMRMGVMMAVPMRFVDARRIGAALRIEWRFDLSDLNSEAAQHRLDDMVTPQSKPVRQDLNRQVPVAKVPGGARQLCGIGAANFGQRLGRGDDFNKIARNRAQAHHHDAA